MKEEFAMLAHTYNPMVRYIGWMMSRKLNGWGCLWDGGITRGMKAKDVPWYFEGGDDKLKEEVISTGLWTIGRADKYGIRPKSIYAPDGWLDQLPVGVPLQGELWWNDNLSFVKMVCGRRTIDARWSSIKFCVYNVKPYSKWQGIEKIYQVDEPILNSTFFKSTIWRDRMAKASECVSMDNKVIDWVTQTKIKDEQHLNEAIKSAQINGWEGLMLVNPISYYETQRSYNLVKVKPIYETEAEVVGYEEGKTGKNIGRLGSVLCKLKWGDEVLSYTGGSGDFIGKEVCFGVSGWDDSEREWEWIKGNYPIGSLLHFSFLGVSTHGVPCSCNRLKED